MPLIASASVTATAPVVTTEDELLRTAPLPHERVVYWGSGSPQAWRVLIALEEKRVPYRSICVSFSSGALKSPFFRALNPRMRVPVLIEPVEAAATTATATGVTKAISPTNGAATTVVGSPNVASIAHGVASLLSLPRERVVVYESTAILEFLERKFPLAPSMPTADHLPQYALAQSRMHEANEILSVVGDLVVYLRRFPPNMRSASVVATKWATLDAELALWEAYLASHDDNGAFLVEANTPYLCDFSLFTNVAYAVRCGLQLGAQFPRLALFYSRLCARPSIDATWPPHWRTSPGSRVLIKCSNCVDRTECVCELQGSSSNAIGGGAPMSSGSLSAYGVSPPQSQSQS